MIMRLIDADALKDRIREVYTVAERGIVTGKQIGRAHV